MNTKALGFSLLGIGIAVMLFSLVNVFMVFTGRTPAYDLFSFNGVSTQIQGVGSVEILPSEILNSTTNTISHVILMGFVLTFGYKLALLGVNIIRPVKITSKEENSS